MLRTANPALNEKAFEQFGAVTEPRTMTLQGTVNRTFILLGCAIATASYTWHLDFTVGWKAAIPWAIGGAIGGLIFGLISSFAKSWCPVTSVLYALAEGLFLLDEPLGRIDVAAQEHGQREPQVVHQPGEHAVNLGQTFGGELQLLLDLLRGQLAKVLINDVPHVLEIDRQGHDLPIAAALGLREFVPQMSLAAVAAGADALMIEVHDSPEQAKSDGNQALTPEIFAELVPRLRAVAAAIVVGATAGTALGSVAGVVLEGLLNGPDMFMVARVAVPPAGAMIAAMAGTSFAIALGGAAALLLPSLTYAFLPLLMFSPFGLTITAAAGGVVGGAFFFGALFATCVLASGIYLALTDRN